MAPGELKRRWAVAITLVPLVIGMLYRGGWVLGVPLAFFSAVGTAEFFRLAHERSVEPFRWVGIVTSVALVLLATWEPVYRDFAPPALGVIMVLVAVTLVLALFARGPERGPMGAASATVVGVLYVSLPFACWILLRELPTSAGWGRPGDPTPWMGVFAVSLPLAATWIGDASAFFAGTWWGRKRARLAPSISPNKSWVGAYACVIGGAAGTAAWYLVAESSLPGMPIENIAVAALLGAVISTSAIVGDLIESLLKREAGVKDSGAVFPGHGGVLDRLDALHVSLPIAYVLMVLLDALK